MSTPTTVPPSSTTTTSGSTGRPPVVVVGGGGGIVSSVTTGRVVRLHFTCYAELPIGSMLRVTGSSLWAPTSLTSPSDPMNAHTIAQHEASDGPGYQTYGDDTEDGIEYYYTSHPTNLYSSSVEMVTSPEMYPIWKTRQPVIVVLQQQPSSSRGGPSIQKHHYRYLVVTPGARISSTNPNTDKNQNHNQVSSGGGGGELIHVDNKSTIPQTSFVLDNGTLMADISTSDGHGGASPVMMWEQPQFPMVTSSSSMNSGTSTPIPGTFHGVSSSVTLGGTSVVGGTGIDTESQLFLQLARLPYRTIDIHIETGTVVSPSSSSNTNDPNLYYDIWNGVDDVTFRPYLIRESMMLQKDRNDIMKRVEERRSAAMALSLTGTTAVTTTSATAPNIAVPGGTRITVGRTSSNISDDLSTNSSSNSVPVVVMDNNNNMNNIPMDENIAAVAAAAVAAFSKQSMLLPPQVPTPLSPSTTSSRILFICFHLPVVVVKVHGEWQASWSESLLASKEGSMVVANYRAHWVGTVTAHPPIVKEEDKVAVRALLKGMDCTPIFLNPSTRQAHYYGFCKQVLWPAFHNIDLLDLSTTSSSSSSLNKSSHHNNNNNPTGGSGSGGGGGGGGGLGSSTTTTTTTTSEWDQSRLDHWWDAYQQVNHEFATVVQELVSQDNTTTTNVGAILGGALGGMVLGGGGTTSSSGNFGGGSAAGGGGYSSGGNAAAYAAESTYLWIHDYHLSLLPRYLSMDGTSTKFCRKVFFLHIPFPTSQIFRELECGEDILDGMLHADVVGFHAFDHARHFLNATKRIMGLNYESLVGGLIGLNFQGRTVLVSMSNVSIEPKMVDAALKLPAVQDGCIALQQAHCTGGSSGIDRRQIICSLDVGQRLSGSSLKLLAYERLLQDYPVWQNKVVMVLRVLVPGSRKRDEAITTQELRSMVQRLQDKYGPAVIDYREIPGGTLPLDQRLALWKASDVLMLTPIREGLNHWPMEYIYCKQDPASPGVVIASEFSANCSILNGALRVNPFDIQMTVTVMDKALTMDRAEKEGRRYRDLDFVSNSPSDRWVKNVLRDLNDAYTASSSANSGSNNAGGASGTHSPRTPTPGGGGRRASSTTSGHHRSKSISRVRKEEIQGTAAFLLKESHAAFSHLSPKVLKHAYDITSRRVIFLDFNGTIVLKEPPGKYLKREILGTSGNKPPPQVLEALALLCRDPKNTVYVVSGDSSENVLSALGHIRGLGLAVSNGAQFSPPMMNDRDEDRKWQTFDLGVDWDAVKRVALPVLSKYTARSNGSFVKLTTLSIGWSYYSCDPEWGSLQASHLVLELESHLRAFDVRFVTLKGVVEIVPRKLNKGLIVKKVLRDISKTPTEPPIDFVLCLGDDISDEKMFTSVFSFIAEMGDPAAPHLDPPVINASDGTIEEPKPASAMTGKAVPDPMYCYTCAVGKKPSHASMYVTDAQEVANALVLLAKGEFPPGGVHAAWGRDTQQDLFI